jgi:glycosyltransferase involved in cell wall biosynthesis
MKKIKLIYDVSAILSGQINNSSRTGVYFCSLNILERLKKYNDIEIYPFTRDKSLLSASKKINILNGLKFIKIQENYLQENYLYKENIHFHLNSINNSDNIMSKIISLLKIIKNVLYIIFNIEKKINMRLKEVDAFFSPYDLPLKVLKNYNIKKFILLYDVTPILFSNYFSEGNSSLWINNMLKYLCKETYCFCISESTKRDFIKYFGEKLDENKMTVTYISSANEFETKYDHHALRYIANKYKINIDQFKYIFSFCSLEHRKNLIFTINCFIKFIQRNNINDLYFLLGGVQWDNFTEHFNETLVKLPENYRAKIKRLGYVEDIDVNMLYSNSLFFIYLSQYEGFGIPPLEAMQAGTPVICSNNSSLPEVVGDAAITIDYNDEEACINAMETFYFNEEIRQKYIKKGFERAKLFSWNKTVDLITNKIKEVTQAQ